MTERLDDQGRSDKPSVFPINNDLTRLLDKMHDAILDTEASGRPAGNLFDVWWELKAELERCVTRSAGTSIIGQSRNTDKLVMLVRWLVTHPGECIGDHPDVLAQAKLALASSRCPACGQDDKTVCYDARCPYEMRTPHSASERTDG